MLPFSFRNSKRSKIKSVRSTRSSADYLQEKLPAAKNVEWSKENENELEAEFKNGSLATAANFDTAGEWLITETEIKKSEIPITVQGTLKKEFAGYEAKEVEMAATP